MGRAIRPATAAILALFAAAALWNAARYPPGLGYDAVDHIAYAELLVERGELPDGVGQFYTPPLFYAVAGTAAELGAALGLGEPLRAAQLVNALLALGTAVLLLALARTLWPGRTVLHLAALGFFAFGAVVLKAAAMFHPETLSMFLSTLAVLVAARMIVGGRYGRLDAVALGLALGLAQLVRAWSLLTFVVVVSTFAIVGLRRREAWRSAAWAVAAVALVTAPWYVHQQVRYGTPLAFGRETPGEPIWERRPASFYVDPGLSEVVTEPYRPHFTNRFWPTVYAEGWGDWFGVWAWRAAEGRPSPGERRELVGQSAVGILPSAIALAGLGVVLVGAARRPELLLVGLLALAGIAGLLYFTVRNPSPDGDVIKATYMLTSVPAWALAFGCAVDAIRLRSRLAGAALTLLLVASAAVSLRFATY